MQKKLQLSPLYWAGIIVAVLLLICVRMFQQSLFYDPFIVFFKKVDKTHFPDYNVARLFLNYFFRYAINTLLSLFVLWLMFKDLAIIKLTTLLYVFFFVVLAVSLYVVLQQQQPLLNMVFYIRRFLMQPLPLLLFVPAFYYQKYMKS